MGDKVERESTACICPTDILLTTSTARSPKRSSSWKLYHQSLKTSVSVSGFFFPSVYQVDLFETVFLNCYVFFLHFDACWTQIPQFTPRPPHHLRSSCTSETIPFPSSTSISKASTMCCPNTRSMVLWGPCPGSSTSSTLSPSFLMLEQSYSLCFALIAPNFLVI